jgi:hypothetical protein
MSRPRGVRTGAEMPASKTISEKRRTRSGLEHSYGAPGHGLNGIRLTLAGSLYCLISLTSSRASSSLSFLSLSITYSNVIRRAFEAPG